MIVIRYIVGFFIALALLPVLGVCWIGIVAYAGLSEFWRFFYDLWRSVADPAYIPNIGYRSMCRRQDECIRASAAAEKDDWAAAVSHWKIAARLYDIPSMVRLGECFEAGKGVEANSGFAYEYYSLAAQYGNQEGRDASKRLRECRMPSRQRREFAKTMWN